MTSMRASPQGNECPISLEPFQDDSLVVVLECYHVIEKTAWNSYVAARTTWDAKEGGGELCCPVCRHPCIQIPAVNSTH
jgi:hypothetical protein